MSRSIHVRQVDLEEYTVTEFLSNLTSSNNLCDWFPGTNAPFIHNGEKNAKLLADVVINPAPQIGLKKLSCLLGVVQHDC